MWTSTSPSGTTKASCASSGWKPSTARPRNSAADPRAGVRDRALRPRRQSPAAAAEHLAVASRRVEGEAHAGSLSRGRGRQPVPTLQNRVVPSAGTRTRSQELGGRPAHCLRLAAGRRPRAARLRTGDCRSGGCSWVVMAPSRLRVTTTVPGSANDSNTVGASDRGVMTMHDPPDERGVRAPSVASAWPCGSPPAEACGPLRPAGRPRRSGGRPRRRARFPGDRRRARSARSRSTLSSGSNSGAG